MVETSRSRQVGFGSSAPTNRTQEASTSRGGGARNPLRNRQERPSSSSQRNAPTRVRSQEHNAPDSPNQVVSIIGGSVPPASVGNSSQRQMTPSTLRQSSNISEGLVHPEDMLPQSNAFSEVKSGELLDALVEKLNQQNKKDGIYGLYLALTVDEMRQAAGAATRTGHKDDLMLVSYIQEKASPPSHNDLTYRLDNQLLLDYRLQKTKPGQLLDFLETVAKEQSYHNEVITLKSSFLAKVRDHACKTRDHKDLKLAYHLKGFSKKNKDSLKQGVWFIPMKSLGSFQKTYEQNIDNLVGEVQTAHSRRHSSGVSSGHSSLATTIHRTLSKPFSEMLSAAVGRQSRSHSLNL